MAKDKERQLAEYFYIEKHQTAKEIAGQLGLTEATVGNWISKYGWRERREALAISASNQCANIEQVISDLAKQRIELSRELTLAVESEDNKLAAELRKALAALDDGAAKWAKTLEVAKKRGEVSISIYLEVMDKIFAALREYDYKIYLSTVNFQDHHIREISSK